MDNCTHLSFGASYCVSERKENKNSITQVNLKTNKDEGYALKLSVRENTFRGTPRHTFS